MAEAAGLAIGLVSLAGLFGTCVDAIEKIQIGRRLQKDRAILQQKLDNQRERFRKWGESTGFTAEQSSGRDTPPMPCRDKLPGAVSANVANTMQLLVDLFESGSQLNSRYGAVQEANSTPESGRKSLRSLFKQTCLSPSESSTPDQKKRGTMHWVVSDRNNFERLVDDLRDLVDDLVVLTSASVSSYKRLLQALKFPEMKLRQAQIKPEESETFQWIFYNDADNVSPGAKPFAYGPWDNFRQWLLHDSTSYWISGKPGSGKSTLMRYIWDQPTTLEALKSWSGGLRLSMSCFFFWHSGTYLQKSLEGVLRSLVYQILNDFPFLADIAIARLDRFQRSTIDDKEGKPDFMWSEEQLTIILQDLLESKESANLRFCLFLDGLDEFVGDRIVLLKLLQRIEACSNAKLCASSRPELLFKRKFESAKTLKVHDLTEFDIVRYVTARMSKHLFPFSNSPTSPQLKDLARAIIFRAEGVFLWVTLVVRNLLEALSNGDTMVDLMRRLEQLPTELSTLYGHLLSHIDPFYREKASTCFEILMTNHHTLGFGTMFLASSDEVQDSFHFRVESNAKFGTDLMQEILAFRKSVLAKTGGLLEIDARMAKLEVPSLHDARDTDDYTNSYDLDTVFHWWTVGFIHRSAYEFLSDIGNRPPWLLRKGRAAILNRLIKARILSIMEMTNMTSISLALVELRTHSSESEALGLANEVAIDALEKVLESKRDVSIWVSLRGIMTGSLVPPGQQISAVHDFLGLMASLGLFLYVEKRLLDLVPPYRSHFAGYLLHCSLEGMGLAHRFTKAYSFKGNVHIIPIPLQASNLPRKLLEDYGANANIICVSRDEDGKETTSISAWGRFLGTWHSLMNENYDRRLQKTDSLLLPITMKADIACAFLNAEADISLPIEVFQYDIDIPWDFHTYPISVLHAKCQVSYQLYPLEVVRELLSNCPKDQQYLKRVEGAILARSKQQRSGILELQIRKGSDTPFVVLKLSGDDYDAVLELMNTWRIGPLSRTIRKRIPHYAKFETILRRILSAHFPGHMQPSDWTNLEWLKENRFVQASFMNYHGQTTDAKELAKYDCLMSSRPISSKAILERMIEWWPSLLVETRARLLAVGLAAENEAIDSWCKRS